MRIVRVTWAGKSAYMRDPRTSGEFLRGVECNAWGIASREGCREDRELMVRLDRIESIADLADGPDGHRVMA